MNIAAMVLLAITVSDPGRMGDEELSVTYPGTGKRIVLISGDEEYRSEEALPQLAKILASRHGFHCTVLFALNSDGEIDPDVNDNIPGLAALRHADLMVISTRFRNLPDAQMKHIVDYVEAGKPIVGLRTATHAFNIPADRKYARYSWNQPTGGFGREFLGETWIRHHGEHGKESTRGVLPAGAAGHPILRGVDSVWGPTDVYGVRLPFPPDQQVLLLGQVLAGMSPQSAPVAGAKNAPMMPVAWTRTVVRGNKSTRVFTTTMGASQDLRNEGLRRMLVNACYWCLGMGERIPDKSDVALVGKYKPSPFGFRGARKGLRPEHHALAAPGDKTRGQR